MKRSWAILLLSVSMAFLAGCAKLAAILPNTYAGNGAIATDVRQPGTFQSVELDGAYDVVLTQGAASEVRIETDQNLLPHIQTMVSNGTLTVESDGNIEPSKSILVYISSPNYRSVESNGSSDIRGATPIASDELKLALDGSGSYTLGLNVKRLKSEIEGSGTISLTGMAGNHSSEINGSGDLRTDSLAVDSATIAISGSGDARVNVRSRLDASINGAARVRYRGPVTDVHTEISGSGSVDRASSSPTMN
ncbi:MAG TPA: head GIN domain-containing protein [Candidatus Kapabacteria bacterium]|nr:head GIN domain-containing protein [Candidatus Kapabacteria bacterium]